MSDYEIGYGKPPKASQFKPGVSPNPTGRPKRQQTDLTGIIVSVLNAPIEHQEGGQKMTTSAWVLNLRMLVQRAVRGSVDAAMELLKIWIHAGRSKSGIQRVEVHDWLPDYPGQTAEQKTRDFAQKRNAASVEWWSPLGAGHSKPKG
jgi:hypothetical protein